MLAHLEALLGRGRQDRAQGIALGQPGQEALHRGGLLPELEIGHQLVAAAGTIPAEADIGAFGLGDGQIGDHGLAAVAPHRPLAFAGLVAQVAQGLDQGATVAQFGLDGAEVGHRGTLRRTAWGGRALWAGGRTPEAGLKWTGFGTGWWGLALGGLLLQRSLLMEAGHGILAIGLGGGAGGEHGAQAGLDRASEGLASGSLDADHLLLNPAIGQDAVTNRLLAHARCALSGMDANRGA